MTLPSGLAATADAAEPLGTAERLLSVYRLRRAMRLNGMAACGLTLLLATPATQALELGEARVVSHLGEALVVDIPIRLNEFETLSPDCIALTRGADVPGRLPAYTSTQRVFVDSGRLRIVGRATVHDPLIGLNVKIACRTAPRIERSYQLFVDPAGMATATTAPAAAEPLRGRPAAVGSPVAGLPAPRRALVSARARGDAGQAIAQGSRYTVVPGDTLTGIVKRIDQRRDTIWATAEIVFAANSDAFTNGDMDRLEAGQTLAIPVLDGTPAATVADDATQPTPVATTATAPAAVVPTPVDAGAAITELEAAPDTGVPVPELDISVESRAAAPAAPVEVASAEPAVPAAEPEAAAPAAEVIGSAALGSEPGAGEFEADGESTWSGWLAGIIAMGAAIVLALMLLPAVRRRRSDADTDAKADFLDDTSLTRVIADGKHFDTPTDEETDAFQVTDETGTWKQPEQPTPAASAEGSLTFALDDARNADFVDDSLNDALEDMSVGFAETDSFDLEIDAGPNQATEAEESVIIEAEVGQELSDDVPKLRPEQEDPRSDITVAELNMLEQDYEAEFTATQQLNQDLANAVADLKRTEAALASGDVTEDDIVPVDATDALDGDANYRDDAATALVEPPAAEPVARDDEAASLADLDDDAPAAPRPWDDVTSESALLMGAEILGSEGVLDIGDPLDADGDDMATVEMPADEPQTVEIAADDGPTVDMPLAAEGDTTLNTPASDKSADDSAAEFINLDDWDETIESPAPERRNAR